MDKKYAIIQLGGKQMMVTEGQVFEIDRQKDLNIGVLLYSDEKGVEVGNPLLADVKVNAKVMEEKTGKKITVARFKSKSRYRKKKGHRQPLSVIKVESITKGSKAKKTSPRTTKEE